MRLKLTRLVLMIICLLRGETTASVTLVINNSPTAFHPFVSAAPTPPPNCPLSTSQYYVMSFITLPLTLSNFLGHSADRCSWLAIKILTLNTTQAHIHISVELQPTNCTLVYDLPSSHRFVQRSMSHTASRQYIDNMGEFKNSPITV